MGAEVNIDRSSLGASGREGIGGVFRNLEGDVLF